MRIRWQMLLGLSFGLLAGCSTVPRPQPESGVWPRYVLTAERTITLNPPDRERFDASGLVITRAGDLLTVNDRGPTVYRVEFNGDTADLVPLKNYFTPGQLGYLAADKTDRYDTEGVALDEQGRLYLCEEANRWILRCDPRANYVERLPIDWSPVEELFSKVDANASFEGIAMGKGKLYVANERNSPAIIVVDLSSMKVTGHFTVAPRQGSFFGTHYSGLAWHDGNLFVLCRQHRVVLQVDPATRSVLAEYDYRTLEDRLGYRTQLPFVGIMEGLAVDDDSIWLVTDNNGYGRPPDPADNRPTLLKCPRPERKPR